MNEIIGKCIAALAEKDVKVDYVRGLLEAALAMNGGNLERSSVVEQAVVTRKVGGSSPSAPAEVPGLGIENTFVSPTLLAELKANENKDLG